MGKYKDFIEKAYNDETGLTMCSDWKDLVERTFPEFVPKFEDGDWVWSEWIKEHMKALLIYRKGESELKGFNYGGSWSEKVGHQNNFTKAGPNEIKKALVVEAKKRGFVKGAKFIPFGGTKVTEIEYDPDINRSFFFLGKKGKNEYNMSGKSHSGCFYHAGKWREVIEEGPKKEMTLSEIESKLGHSVKIIP